MGTRRRPRLDSADLGVAADCRVGPAQRPDPVATNRARTGQSAHSQPQEVDMADGGYQRPCTRCNRPWLVPPDIAEERPDFKAAASQYLSLIGGKFADQVALRAHYQQLAAAAKCPQCGATSFAQQKAPDSPASPEPPSAVPPSAPQGSPVPDGQTLIYVLN